jgi:hypothetical protein
VFHAEQQSGKLEKQPDEIMDGFFKLEKETIKHYISRDHLVPRVLDAMVPKSAVPCETWTTDPFKRIERLNSCEKTQGAVSFSHICSRRPLTLSAADLIFRFESQ